MSAIPTADTCDIWEPTEHIRPGGSIYTHTYAKAQGPLPCNFRALTAAQRMMSGLDTTEDKRKLFLYGTASGPSDRALVVNRADGTVWRLDGPATYHKTPVSDGHFQVLLTQDLAPPSEVAGAY